MLEAGLQNVRRAVGAGGFVEDGNMRRDLLLLASQARFFADP
jgi:hypothetical protein